MGMGEDFFAASQSWRRPAHLTESQLERHTAFCLCSICSWKSKRVDQPLSGLRAHARTTPRTIVGGCLEWRTFNREEIAHIFDMLVCDEGFRWGSAPPEPQGSLYSETSRRRRLGTGSVWQDRRGRGGSPQKVAPCTKYQLVRTGPSSSRQTNRVE